jgi:isopentenyl-diphosphate Delta-isomerase
MTEDLILVNAKNRFVGHADKRLVHEAGLLHRAFSIFLVDRHGQLLLQRRHRSKYHSGGLWANSCCGHPRPGERTNQAAQRRLGEELGVTAPLRFGFLARYHTTFPNGLIENEIVYLYFGMAPETIRPNRKEVSSLVFSDLARLKDGIAQNPALYSYWLKYYMTHHFRSIQHCLDVVLGRARPTQKVRALIHAKGR